MKIFRMKMRERSKSFAITLMVIIIAIALSALCVSSDLVMENNLKVLAEHPYKVTSSLQELRQDVLKSREQVSRLASSGPNVDMAVIKERLEKIEDHTDTILEVLKSNYLGSARDVEEMRGFLEELRELQSQVPDGQGEEAEAFLESKLEPVYRQIEEQALKMLEFARNNVINLSKRTDRTVKRDILMTTLISLIMILVAAVYQRNVSRGIQEKEHTEHLFSILSENVNPVFFIYQLKTKKAEYVFSNIERRFGIPAEEIKENVRALFNYLESDQAGEIEAIRNAFTSEVVGELSTWECRLKNPVSGERLPVECRLYPIWENGRLTRYIVSLEDLTEQKRNQQALRDALLAAQDANSAKSDFLSRMSHEIRTPLNAIIGISSLAENVLDNQDKMRDYISKISISSQHLLMLINDILDMSKIDSGKMILNEEPFDMPEFIENLVNIVSLQAGNKKQDFKVDIAKLEHEKLIGDNLKLNQVLLNILSNSVKFTPEGGNIRLQIKELNRKKGNRIFLQFTLSDTGIGMNKEAIDKLFVPFEQGDSSISRQYGGTGLGMAITKNIVTLMGGTIQVFSEERKGTTFVVEIGFEVSGTELERYYGFGDMNVLVADDDTETCEHTTLILKNMGVRAEWVTTGQQAIARVYDRFDRGECYDVAFIDWRMPDINGIEVTRKIREKVGPETMIVIVSAYNWKEIESEALKAGANALIAKPMFQSTIFNTISMAKKGNRAKGIEGEKGKKLPGRRILLVEDNEINMEIVREYLKQMDAVTEEAVNGEEACERFLASEPGYYDLILMDVQMPRMNGYEATRKIRQSGHPMAKAIPIVAMTANAFAEDVVMALESGMNAHIAKPMEIQDLYKTLEEQLRDPK